MTGLDDRAVMDAAERRLSNGLLVMTCLPFCLWLANVVAAGGVA